MFLCFLNSNISKYFKTYNSTNSTQVNISLDAASAYLLYVDAAGSNGSNGSAPRLVVLRTGYSQSNYYARSIYVADANDEFSIKYNNGNYVISLGTKQYVRVGVLQLIKP